MHDPFPFDDGEERWAQSADFGAITGAMQPFMPRQICVLMKNFDLTPLEVKIMLARRLFLIFCF